MENEKYCQNCGMIIPGTGGSFTYTGNIFCTCPQPQHNITPPLQPIPQQPQVTVEKDPHEYSMVQCDLCSHKWRAVRPVGLTKLECPNCKNMTHFEVIAP